MLAAAGVITLAAAGGAVALTTPANALPSWRSVSAGSYTTCVVKASPSTLWCWGRNEVYQLGLGVTGTKPTPQQVGSWTDWATVSVGYFHACGIRNSGALYCWGFNGNYQVGVPPNTNRQIPTRVLVPNVDEQPEWTEISSGNGHTCGIADDGDLYCWGDNDYGQLGLGDINLRTRPTKVAGGPWRGVDAGNLHTCAIGSDDELYCWGDNRYGQLGLGYTQPDEVLKPASQGGAWGSVSAGDDHTCGVSKEGMFPYCWGRDTSGQVGNGSPMESVSTRRRISTNAWGSVSAGGQHSCGVRLNGNLVRFCWGENGDGQLGINDFNDRNAPRHWGGETNWLMVSAGNDHSCGVFHNHVYCWGDNLWGQLGIGTTNNTEPLPVEVLW